MESFGSKEEVRHLEVSPKFLCYDPSTRFTMLIVVIIQTLIVTSPRFVLGLLLEIYVGLIGPFCCSVSPVFKITTVFCKVALSAVNIVSYVFLFSLSQPIIPVFTENVREAFEYMQTGKGN